jgi:streptogramin lyase
MVVGLATWLQFSRVPGPGAQPNPGTSPPRSSPQLSSAPPSVFPAAGSLVRIDAATGAVLARIRLADPGPLTTDGSSVWVRHDRGRSLTRIDPATDTVIGSFDVGGPPGPLVAAGGSIWLSDWHGVLYRLAPGADRVQQANGEVPEMGSLAPDTLVGEGGTLWISWFPEGPCCRLDTLDLHRVDPVSGGVIATIEGAAKVVVSGDGFAWAALNFRPAPLRLVRIDTSTYTTAPIGVLDGPWVDLTVADGSVWASVLDGGGQLVRLDPVSGTVQGTVQVDGAPGLLAAGGGALWATIGTHGTVARFDLETGTIERYNLDGTPEDMLFANGSLWVSLSGSTRG